ncbi:response regulator transcription factor [Maritimibacter sp. DP1N21-5]|uniref:LuxR C-terminal-related transcriptional regulator n=1 Tax=Maritimibacter sp. DP1N21-5 TaxID=2836867 RepID=UPI001C46F387|nr:response regulator transcription factor [Maritimibacter sp. DP1N21-5]MBV7407545.1 response regulator transcription factor [Maritimibacter sp. DP1N21-5]
MERYTMGLFDDHPIVLSGLADIMSKSGLCDVVATGADANAAVEAARDLRPDILLMDLHMPGDVAKAIETISALGEDSRVLVFTASEKPNDCMAALGNGARGYVVKGTSCEELFQAINTVMEGGEFVSPKLAIRLFREMNRATAETAKSDPEIALSAREDQIVEQLMSGASNRDIAKNLRLSEKTVKYYMTQILQKFDAKNRVEVILAVQKTRLQ